MNLALRIADIERAAISAWPALRSAELAGGWLWRHSKGGSGRANSVACLDWHGGDPDAAIADAEARYASVHAEPKFQVTDAAAPADLDARLAVRGYVAYDACTTLARALPHEEETPPGIEIDDRPSDDWLMVYTSVITPDRRPVAPAILARVPRGSGFVGLRRHGRLLATVLTVPVGDIAIVECVATAAEARRQGAARDAMLGAMAYAAGHGASCVALGAVATNAPAQALYAALGFRRVGGYHLRRKDTRP